VKKFAEAGAFKSELDQQLRKGEEVVLSYGANPGTMMAVLGLQAYGRLRMEIAGFRTDPFGFEPSKYEGRLFPKSHYRFDVKLVPTDRYVYNEDLAVLVEGAKKRPIPRLGPVGELPIWVNVYGRLNRERWCQYLGMVAFAIGTKGPVSIRGCADLVQGVAEEFEIQLVLDWLEGLGLLDSLDGGRKGISLAEMWWLAVAAVMDDVEDEAEVEAVDDGMEVRADV
jgi:hypothetical protein